MTGHLAQRRFDSVDEFLDWEARQSERFEFLNRQVWPVEAETTGMAGGTIRHNDIVFNVRTILTALFRPRGCRVQSENVKLKTEEFSAYPDVMVVCSPVSPDASVVFDALILVEVISESTERKDRGPKQQNYLDTPFCQHYLLASQDTQLVEVYTRAAGGWTYRAYHNPDDTIDLSNADVRITVGQIYQDTDVPPYRSVIPLGR